MSTVPGCLRKAGQVVSRSAAETANFTEAGLARTTVEARAVIATKIEMDAIAYSPRKA